MAKILCKSVKSDGTPCQGQGLEQFDGFCIAHAPTLKTHAWRSRGGKNASNAARADKRIPERLRVAIEALEKGLLKVQKGELEPAAYAAMCRGAKAMADLYRLADLEMEQIRREETQTAAAEIAGGHGDLDILAAAAEITAQENRFRIQSHITQRLVQLDQSGSENEPAGYVLTDAGRRRFGLQQGVSYTQDDIDLIQALLERPLVYHDQCIAARKTLSEMRAAIEDAIADLARDPGPVLDPITGDPLSQPPAGVKTGALYPADPADPADSADPESVTKALKKQCQQVLRLARVLEFRYKMELGRLRSDPHRAEWEQEEAGEEPKKDETEDAD